MNPVFCSIVNSLQEIKANHWKQMYTIVLGKFFFFFSLNHRAHAVCAYIQYPTYQRSQASSSTCTYTHTCTSQSKQSSNKVCPAKKCIAIPGNNHHKNCALAILRVAFGSCTTTNKNYDFRGYSSSYKSCIVLHYWYFPLLQPNELPLQPSC